MVMFALLSTWLTLKGNFSICLQVNDRIVKVGTADVDLVKHTKNKSPFLDKPST
jgi:hypothetical protein